tara:strand:+ start:407 stop:757 length:351 start_codon:yes stop_codon:yes gene_type:complete
MFNYKHMEKTKMKNVDRIEVEVGELEPNNYIFDIMFFDKKGKFLGKEVIPHLLIHNIRNLIGSDMYDNFFRKRNTKKISYDIETKNAGSDFTIRDVQFWLGNEIFNIKKGKFERVA